MYYRKLAMVLEDVLKKIRTFDSGHIWESFFRVEYGIEWMNTAWEAFKTMNNDYFEYMDLEEIAKKFVIMLNEELDD